MVCSTIISIVVPSAGNRNNYNCILEKILRDFFLFWFYIAVFRENIVEFYFIL